MCQFYYVDDAGHIKDVRTVEAKRMSYLVQMEDIKAEVIEGKLGRRKEWKLLQKTYRENG